MCALCGFTAPALWLLANPARNGRLWRRLHSIVISVGATWMPLSAIFRWIAHAAIGRS